MLISDMEHEVIKNEIGNENITSEIVEEIFNMMPKEAKKLTTMPKTIYESLLKFGLDKVKKTVLYMAKQNSLKSPRAYFLKALENDWAEDIIEIVENKKLDFKEKNFNDKVEEAKKENQNILFSKFEKLPLEIQNGIEGYVYREYIELCGMEKKVQQLAFLGSRKKLICDYLEKYPQLIEKEVENIKKQEVEPTIEESLTILTDKEKLRNYVSEYVNIYIDLIKEENSNLEEIKKKIILDCMRDFLNKTLTLEKLEDIIKKNLI